MCYFLPGLVFLCFHFLKCGPAIADCRANVDENTAIKDVEYSIGGGIDLTIVYANKMPRDNRERTEFGKLACSRREKKQILPYPTQMLGSKAD